MQYTNNGNISNSQDYYNAQWSYGYDTLNRLTSANSNGATYPHQCWSYDPFGNRYFELDMTASYVACPASNAPAGSSFTPPVNAQYLWATYNTSNQVTGTAVNGAAGGLIYDLAGNVTNDGSNQYVYDPEGRICAVKTSVPSYMQYIYDAEGRRVAKGTIGSLPASGSPCAAPTASNGFALTNQYLRGTVGNQDTELDGSGNWQHTNIFGDGGLTATYWNNSGTATLSYNFNDWLGTKRMQATSDSPSMLEEISRSYPYGNLLTVSGNGGDATEHHLTGKERDTESGLDYFGARYYGSSMGRFMSPDWSAEADPVPYAKMGNPQSLNLYAYVADNPITGSDADGHDRMAPFGTVGTLGFEGDDPSNDPTGQGGSTVAIQGWAIARGLDPFQADADFQNYLVGIATAPLAQQHSGAKLPTGKQLTMVQTLMGEQTNEALVGSNQYADGQSGRNAGPPTGAVITDATLDQEADLMAGTMLNLGHIGNATTYRGLPAGKRLTRRAARAKPGSALSTQLQRDISAVRNATPSPYSQWRAVNQGFIRSRGDALRVAGTDFLP